MVKPHYVKITKSKIEGKKLTAKFYDKNKEKIITVHFGATGYEDFTTHGDFERKERYINRHRENENWNNPMTPGSLSRFILWNKKTLNASIKDYIDRFNLKLL